MTALSRRAVVSGFASLPLAAVLADPRLAALAAESLEDIGITTPSGRSVKAALAVPATTPAPAVLLIHEWWGLNDQIKSVAAELAKEGFLALGVDLYDGNVAADPAAAQTYMEAVDAGVATETLVAWIDWLRQDARGTGTVATIGWCFGGGWSLNASLAAPVDATVIYYGNVAHPAAELAKLHGPVLGHFAERDQWIDVKMVEGFEKGMQEAGKPATIHEYSADHGFANPTANNYDREDTQTAWARTLEFLRANLG